MPDCMQGTVCFIDRLPLIEARLTLGNLLLQRHVEGLKDSGCTSSSHFDWQRQLRFEFDTSLDDVVIRQVDCSALDQGFIP